VGHGGIVAQILGQGASYNGAVRVSPGLAAAASLFGLSCTLLVQFHDQPSGTCDDGLCSGPDGQAPPKDAAHESQPEAEPEAAPMNDSMVMDEPSACLGWVSGYYCGNDGLNYDPGTPNDLVLCSDAGSIAEETFCDGGCLHLPAPFPDACNPCVGVPDGDYCGRDLKGFPSENMDFYIQCSAGQTANTIACDHGCLSETTMSVCADGG
jgi:hypothetical protein